MSVNFFVKCRKFLGLHPWNPEGFEEHFKGSLEGHPSPLRADWYEPVALCKRD